MYSIYDYAYNGLLYLNNMARPRHKRLSQLMIYSTTVLTEGQARCEVMQKTYLTPCLSLCDANA